MWKGLCGITSVPRSEREISYNHESAIHLNEMQTTTKNEIPSLRTNVDDAEEPTSHDHKAENFDFGDPCNKEPVQG